LFCVVKVLEEAVSEVDEDEDEDEAIAIVEEVRILLGRLMMSSGFLFTLAVCSCAVKDERDGRCTAGRLAGLWLVVSFSIAIAFLLARLRLRLNVLWLAVPVALRESRLG
jgi:hypothetical protein